MPRFHLDNRMYGVQQNISTTFKTQIAVFGGATVRRGRVVSISVGQDGAANGTDCQIVYAVQRLTTSSGTRSAATLQPIFRHVSLQEIALTAAGACYTAEPTYTATTGTIWSRALNQRASMQWTAPDTDACLPWEPVVDVGLVFTALSPTYAGPVLTGAEIEE